MNSDLKTAMIIIRIPIISNIILVAFSIDKMLNMKTSPPNILKSKLFQWSVVLGIFVFSFLFYSELLVTLKIVKNPSFDIYVCNYGMFDYFYSFLYAQLAEHCVIPFSIMIVTSIITIKQLIECSSNFFIHFVTNSIFRREFFAILVCK